jgi:hypothetical protein
MQRSQTVARPIDDVRLSPSGLPVAAQQAGSANRQPMTRAEQIRFIEGAKARDEAQLARWSQCLQLAGIDPACLVAEAR